MTTWAVMASPSKFHLTSHSNEIHHLQNHATDWQNRRWLISQHTERQPKQYWHWHNYTRRTWKTCSHLCDKLMKAVDKSTPKTYSRNDPKSPISQAILYHIKEKLSLRRLYNNAQDPDTKSTINKLQKEIRIKRNQESTISWGKFCNSISLE